MSEVYADSRVFYCYAECLMQNVIMLSALMQNAIMSVVYAECQVF